MLDMAGILKKYSKLKPSRFEKGFKTRRKNDIYKKTLIH